MADDPPAQPPAADQAATERKSAPEALRPPPGHPRFPLFDSLRGVAAVCVFLVHAAIFSGAKGSWYWPLFAHLDIGVPFFFLLSGFLLYRPFLAARVLGARRIRRRDYLRRRFLRIFPAYWVALTALAVFPGLYGVFTENWWVYYFLLQNYPVYDVTPECAANVFECGLAPTWTLAVEVFFYAVLPIFVLGMALLQRLSPLRSWLPLELGVLAVFAGISVAIQAHISVTDVYTVAFFSPLGRAWWFGLGMGLAALSVWIQQRGAEPSAVRLVAEHPLVPWLLALALYVGASLFWLEEGPLIAGPVVARNQYVGSYVLFGLIAALVVLPAIFGASRRGLRDLPRHVLDNRIVRWLGLISYGLFLWHVPVVIAVVRGGVGAWWPDMAFPLVAAVAFAITTVLAALSYYLVERPLMRFK